MINFINILEKFIVFYSQYDEDNFFNWITKIHCIIRYKGTSDGLLLEINTNKLNKDELYELSALFIRYNIDTKPLKLLKHQYGPEWNINLLDLYNINEKIIVPSFLNDNGHNYE